MPPRKDADSGTTAATLAFLATLEREAHAPAEDADAQRAVDALQRIAAQAESYRGAQVNRLNKDWQPANRSGDAAIGDSWPLLTARIRDQIRNEPILAAALRALTKGVIGTGISSYANVLLSTEELFDEHNAESDEAFERWSDEEADAEDRLAFPEMQWLHFEETVSVGEALMLKCQHPDPARSVPLCYQLLEAEQLDDTIDQPAGVAQNEICRGIEYDRRGRAVAYYIYDAHPFGLAWHNRGASTRIPADRIIHSFLPGRPSERRGVSWFANMMQPSRDVDWYLGNELTAAAIGALFTVLITRANGPGQGTGFQGSAGETSATDANGNQLSRLGRGTIMEGATGDDCKIIASNRPNANADPFIRLMLQLSAMGAGISSLRLTGDYRQSSYTSARGAHLDDDAYFKPIQRWAGRTFCQPVRRAFNAEAAAYGLFQSVSAAQFEKQQRRFQRMHLQGPGRDQLDPGLETRAAADRIRFGFSDWESECAQRGTSFRRVILKQKQQRAFATKHGVPLELGTNPQGTPGSGPSAGQARPEPASTEADE